MDYVEGPTLAQYIRTTSHTGKFPPPNEIVQLFASISRAIDYTHQQGMIHLDIKPSNILLDQRYKTHNPMGEPVLTDFGIAKLLGASSGTVSGVWVGTPLYISPEQAQGQPGKDRSDIYSLGVILYEVCTGVTPFQGFNRGIPGDERDEEQAGVHSIRNRVGRPTPQAGPSDQWRQKGFLLRLALRVIGYAFGL